ncbi:MAG: hypothetical protein IJC15_03865 [Clostridia bacterium]|nr:hypothetical protein [Clostridia bacterium]
MKKSAACILALLCLTACIHENAPREAETSAVPETTYINVFSPEDDGRFSDPVWQTDFAYGWSDSLYVVHATVSAIGEAYLYDGSTISPNDSEKIIIHKMTKIRTPLTLTVIEDFKGVLSPGDELILTEFWGEMNGYLMKDSKYILPQLGDEYIFFINPITDSAGETFYCAWTQNSVHINTDSEKDFEPLFRPYLYDPTATPAEIITATRALGKGS